jgi:single-strand DNA-binding protein
MASYNRVILVGNLTRDPELRYTPTGTPVCEIGLAVNNRYKNAGGEWVDETTFVDVTLWSRTAEVASEYLNKGSPVLVEGRLKLDTWESTDGQKRSKLRVVGERMQMLGGKGGGGGPPEGGSRPPARRSQPQPQSQYSQSAPPRDEFEAPPPDMPPGDDIPF